MKSARKLIASSKKWNKDPEFLFGLRWFSFNTGIVAALLVVILAHMLKDVAGSLGGLILLTGVCLPVFAAQWLIGKNYDFENLEILKSQLLEKIQKRKPIHLGNEMEIKEQDDGLYGYDGVEIIGFEVNLPEELNEDSIEIFLSKFEDLLKNLPIGFRLRFYRQSLKLDEIKSSKEEILRKNRSYVIFDVYPSLFSYKLFQKRIKNLSGIMFRELGTKELSEITQKLINPDCTPRPINDYHPWYKSPISILRDKALAHMGEIEERSLSISLAELPEQVGNNFQKLYDILNRGVGTIAITYEALANELYIPTARTKLIAKILERNKKADDYVDPDDRIRHRVHISALIQGTKAELLELERKVEDEISRLSEEERPYFARDNANLDKAILAMLPGKASNIPYRKQLIVNKKEAVRYLPLPIRQGSHEAPLKFRTEANSSFGWDVDSGHPTLVVAKVESGKSTLLASVGMAHMRKKGKVASFSMEVGGTFEAYTDGLCEAYFSLERNDKTSTLIPLPDHPLRVFLSFGAFGKAKALEWLQGISGVGTSRPLLTECLEQSLSRVIHQEKYSIDDLYKFFKEAVKKAYPKVDEDHSSRKALYQLEAYTSKTDNGKFFNPIETKEIDYTKAYHWYFRQKSASKEPDELASAFFSFGLHILTVLRSRWDSEGVDPRSTLIEIDEIHYIFEYISKSYWLELNKHGRKQNQGIIMSTQNTGDIKDKLGEEEAEAFLASFSRIIFYHGVSSMRDLAKTMNKIDKVDEVTSSFSACSRRIEEYRARGYYAWGFINEFAEFDIYILDLDRKEVWEVDSRPTGRYIRRKVINATKLNYFEACEKLALYGPKTFHKSKLPEDEVIDEIIKKVRYGKEEQ